MVIPLNPVPAFNKVVPSKVKPDSPSNVFAVPEPVISLLFALLFIVVPVMPVKFEPSIAGSVDGDLASGIVPELRFDALR